MIIRYSLPLNPGNPARIFQTDLDTLVIGRNPGEDRQIDVNLARDEYVSEVHARILWADGGYWIEDMGSANGTFVNGREVAERTPVGREDSIQVGGTVIHVEDERTQALSSETAGAGRPATGATRPGKPSGRTTDFGPDDTTVVDPEDGTGPDGSTDILSTGLLRQLMSANNLCRRLAAAEDVQALVRMIDGQLKTAVPNAQRGAILLADHRGRLNVKANWPSGEPSVSMTWVYKAYESREAFRWQASEDTATGWDSTNSTAYFNLRSALYAPLWNGSQVFGVMCVDNIHNRNAFSSTDLEFFKVIANHVALVILERFSVEGRPGHLAQDPASTGQFSPRQRAVLAGDRGHRAAAGERVEPVTVLAAAICGFADLTWGMDPVVVMDMLNEMFEAFQAVVFAQDGVVDHRVGQGLQAVFGAPGPDDRQWEKAVTAAMNLRAAVEQLGKKRRKERLPAFQVGIGVHAGAVIQGFVGTRAHRAYTVVGDTVDRARRYGAGAGPGQVVISPEVFDQVRERVQGPAETVLPGNPGGHPDLSGYVIQGMAETEGTRPVN